MAKENYVRLRGQLRTDIATIKNPDTGEIKTAVFPLAVIRRNIYNRAGNLNVDFDRPMIATSDKEMLRSIGRIKKHDIVDIKGTFRTQKAIKKVKCPECGAVNLVECYISTINPVYIGVVEDRIDNVTDGTNYLLHCAEVSNEVKMIGRVFTPTDKILTGETDRGDVYTKYQLAVNRKLYIKGSIDEEDHTDYPYVCSYKDVAEDDIQVLVQGALIYLDGYLHTMKREKHAVCSECKKEFSYVSQDMQITPYSNEYLRDYKDDVLVSKHTKVDVEPEEPDHDIGEE